MEAGDLSNVKDWNPQAGSFSNRVSSLTNTSQQFLKGIGTSVSIEFYSDAPIHSDVRAWNYVQGSRTTPVEEMQVRLELPVMLPPLMSTGVGRHLRC